jgi:hypothetical protein
MSLAVWGQPVHGEWSGRPPLFLAGSKLKHELLEAVPFLDSCFRNDMYVVVVGVIGFIHNCL